ncbi:hypothetical protein ATCC90586_010424 [Pythium insidiosum]|nr:hypothetical protein ATCC90586_010424 [Pythium insidiosum]
MMKSAGGLADEDEVRSVAEQYMGKSKADVNRMQEDIYLKDSIIAGLERYVQELVEQQAPLTVDTTATQQQAPTAFAVDQREVRGVSTAAPTDGECFPSRSTREDSGGKVKKQKEEYLSTAANNGK